MRVEIRTIVDIEAVEKDGKIKPFEKFVFVSSVFLILLFFMKSLPSFDNTPATYLYTKNCSNFSCTGRPNNQTGFVENLSLVPLPKVNNSSTTIFGHLPSPLNNWGNTTCEVLPFDRYRYGADILLVCWVLTLFIFAALISNKILPIFTFFFIILLFVISITDPKIPITQILFIIFIIALVLSQYLPKKRISLEKIIPLDKFLIASTNTQLVLIFIGVAIWVLNKLMPEKYLSVSLMPCIPEETGFGGMLLLNCLLPGLYLILFLIFLRYNDENSV